MPEFRVWRVDTKFFKNQPITIEDDDNQDRPTSSSAYSKFAAQVQSAEH